MTRVILVDREDNEIGTMEKMEVHEKGLLHRAFSVFLFNAKGELMLQKRALNKYHSGGLWTNTCCSHPHPGESADAAARRTLQFEMGIDLQPEFAFKFIYQTALSGNLSENEFDYVYTGHYDFDPMINVQEAEAWKFMHPREITAEITIHPEQFSSWFKLIMQRPEMSKYLT